jgi:uncharacterized coiled-coil protein SlyX
MLQKLEARIIELEKAIEQSAAQHNGLVGMLMETRNILKMAKEELPVVENVLAQVDQAVSEM